MNRNLDAIVLRYAGYALVFVLGAFGLYLVRGALPIFGVALLFAYALEPVLRRLEARSHSRRSAVGFIALVGFLLFVCGIGVLASAWQQAQSLNANFGDYQERAVEIAERGRERLNDAPLPEKVRVSIDQAVSDLQTRAPRNASKWLQNALAWVLGSLGVIGIALVVVPVLTLYFMLEMNPLRARLLMLVPAAYRRDVTDIGTSINELLGRYVRGQMIVCSSFGVLCTMGFSILGWRYGMDYALVLGLIAALIYIVPYLGMISVAGAAGLTAYFTADVAPLECATIAVLCCIAFNLIIDYGLAPRVLGRGVGLHPVLVIFALLSGVQVGGIMGMILAVPVFASLRVIVIYLFPQLAAPIPITLSEAGNETEPMETPLSSPLIAPSVPADVSGTSDIVQQTVQAEASQSHVGIFQRMWRGKE